MRDQAKPEPDPLGGLWDARKVATYLDMPVRTLDWWATTGRGPKYLRVGRYRRYRPQDVIAWVESRLQGGAA